MFAMSNNLQRYTRRARYYRRHLHDLPLDVCWENGEYFSDLRRETRQFNWARACDNANEARLFMFCYSEQRHELFLKHGLKALFGTPETPVLAELPNLLWHILQSCLSIRTRSTDARMVLDEVSHMIGTQHPIEIGKQVGFNADEDDANAEMVMREVYDLAVRKNRSAHDLDIGAKSLVVLAFILDIERVKERQRTSEDTLPFSQVHP